jgi:cytochrome c556
MMKRYIFGSLGLVLFIYAGIASSQSIEKAIKYRQGAFAVMGWNFGAIVDMIKGKRPFDQEDFARRAKLISDVSFAPIEGFIADSFEGPTKSKAEIWTNFADFEVKMKQMQEAAIHLSTISLSGDYDASKRAAIKLGKTCKSCHDEYRNK